MPAAPLVQAKSITVCFDNTLVFKEFSACVEPGGHLVLVGENGSGKSTLLKLFAGEIRLSQIPLEGLEHNGHILWNFEGTNETSALAAKEHVRLVSPAQQSTYIRQGWRISGEEIILSGFSNTPLLYSAATKKEKHGAHELARQAGAAHLLSMPAPDMSQGQLRAMLILRAMAARPKLLLLDEPMEGLDTSARSLLTQLMRLAADQGSTLVMTAHRHSDAPQWIKNICTIAPHGLIPVGDFPLPRVSRENGQPKELSNGLTHLPKNLRSNLFDQLFPPYSRSSESNLAREGEASCKGALQPDTAFSPVPAASPLPATPSATGPTLDHTQTTQAGFSAGSLPPPTSEHFKVPIGNTSPPPLSSSEDHGRLSTRKSLSPALPTPDLPAKDVITLDNVDVYIDRTLVLEDITWHIKEGQHWLVLGENGSGKSTLLRLLHGEEFAAWGGSLRWFGKPPLPLAQLQKSVGYVSDRLHSLYTYDMTARDVVLSGADGSIGIYRDLSLQERRRAEHLMEYFEIAPFAHNLFHSLSSGQGRRVLLARVLVCSPKVLLLDEPFSGLDSQNRALWLHTLTLLSSRGLNIIFVSHHKDDYANFFTHQLTLANGRIVEKKAF